MPLLVSRDQGALEGWNPDSTLGPSGRAEALREHLDAFAGRADQRGARLRAFLRAAATRPIAADSADEAAVVERFAKAPWLIRRHPAEKVAGRTDEAR